MISSQSNIVVGHSSNIAIDTGTLTTPSYSTWDREFELQGTALQFVVVLGLGVNGDEMGHVAVVIHEFLFFVMDHVGDDLKKERRGGKNVFRECI